MPTAWPNLLPLVLTPPESSLLYVGQYDALLVTLSVGIAILSSYAVLLVAQELGQAAPGQRRAYWIALGGLCMGAGTWAMHFTGMLAFSLPCTTTYDPVITGLSMLPGVLASALAVSIISRPNMSLRTLLVGGLLLGAGIGAMHYTGMAAYRMNGLIVYNAYLFALSLVVAILLAMLALWVKFFFASHEGYLPLRGHVLAAVIMGAAISGMHYTAMAAAYFVRDGEVSAAPTLTPGFLASTVLMITTVLVFLTMTAPLLARSSIQLGKRQSQILTVLLVGWTLVAWFIASAYTASQQTEAYEREATMSTQQALLVARHIDESLVTLRGVPATLSRNEMIRAAALLGESSLPESDQPDVRKRLWTEDARLANLNRYFALLADNLKIDAVWLLRANGDCIAASNGGTPGSFVGVNYAFRQYYLEAKAGNPGQQYAVGSVSKVPGLYYSHPIFADGRFIGVIVVKRDIASYAHWLSEVDGFMIDEHRIVVLAEQPALMFRRLPDSTIDSLTQEEKQRLYQRTEFEPLQLNWWKDSSLPNVLRIGSDPAPTVLGYSTLADHGLSIYVPRPAVALARLEAERFWLFLLAAVAGNMLILALGATYLYLQAKRKAEQVALRNAAQLEEEVRERTADLRLANERLQEARNAAESAMQAKSAFLANMSHEIRTPMNAIIGMTHLMRRDGVAPELAGRLDNMDAAGRHLLGVINQILDLSKIEAGKLTLEEGAVSVGSVVAGVVSMVSESARAKNLQLLTEVFEQATPLIGDAAKLSQALLNLVGNAIKFTESGSITLSARVEEDGAEDLLVRFDVVDTGIGIAPEAIDRLF